MLPNKPKIYPLSHFLRNGKVFRKEEWEPINPNNSYKSIFYYIDYNKFFSLIECYDTNHCIEVWRMNKIMKTGKV